jgi:hypothetical protein
VDKQALSGSLICGKLIYQRFIKQQLGEVKLKRCANLGLAAHLRAAERLDKRWRQM